MVVGRRARLALVLALLGTLLAILPAAPLAAAGPVTYVVTNTLDNANDANCAVGSCTLRQAVEVSDANDPGAGNRNAITFAAGVTGTITLTLGTLTLSKGVAITGPGADLLAIDGGCTTCDPGGAHTDGVRVFSVGNAAATITGLTIQHGSGGGGGTGGGIDSEMGGTVTVRDDRIARNAAQLGGAIFNIASSTLIVDRTTFEGNTANNGGAIANYSGGILTVTNSTFANNQSQYGGAVYNFGQATVTAATIAGNGGAATNGGGIHNLGTLTLAESIVAGNSGTGPDVFAAVPVTDGGYNVIGSPTNNLFFDGINHDRVGAAAAPLDPKLGPLANNGGPTDTLLPQTGSPALDAGGTAANGCPAADQRGVARPQGAACDSGAVEVAYTTAVNSAADGPADVRNCLQGNANTCRLRDAIAAVNQGLVPAVPIPTISFALPGGGPHTIVAIGSPLPALTASMTIDGATEPGYPASAIVVDGNSLGSALTVQSGTTALNALTIRHGGNTATGGGIYNLAAVLTVTNSTIAANAATGANTYGGGILNDSGTLTVTDSTIAGNSATGSNIAAGGGIFNNGVASSTIINSTIAGNTATGGNNALGAGILNNSGGSLTITNATIAGNTAAGSGALCGGGGIFNGGTLAATNMIVAGNTACANPDLSGPVTSGTNNLIGGAPLLGTLGDYGGTTQTVPLLPGSPAIDAGAAAGSGPAGATVPAADQRGVGRVGPPDIGAFESRGFTLTPAAGSTPQSAPVGTAFANPLALTVAANNPVEPVLGGVISFAATPAGNGATATLSVPTATIGAGGGASVTATANGIAGAYTVTASAMGARAATFSLTNTAPTIALAPPILPNGAAEQPYSQQLAASGTGSTAPYTFAVTAGALPAGLTLDATGLLHGTPTVAGSFPFTVTATDANLFTGTQGYTLVVTAPTVVVAPTVLPAGVKGVAYPAATITASGGMASYTFSVTTGALPGGLTLNPTTGVLSGTPTATGTFPFTITATDTHSFTGSQAYTIAVTAAPLVSIAVTPNPATLKVGQVQQFTATGTYADSSTVDLTSQVTWSSDAPNAATVDPTGKVTGKSAGSAQVTATQGAVSGQATVAVTPPVLTGVQPAPAPQGRPSGASASGTATPAPAPAPAPTGSPASGGSAPVSAPTGR